MEACVSPNRPLERLGTILRALTSARQVRLPSPDQCRPSCQAMLSEASTSGRQYEADWKLKRGDGVLDWCGGCAATYRQLSSHELIRLKLPAFGRRLARALHVSSSRLSWPVRSQNRKRKYLPVAESVEPSARPALPDARRGMHMLPCTDQ